MPMTEVSSPIRRKRTRVARDGSDPFKSRNTPKVNTRTGSQTPIRAPLAAATNTAQLSPRRTQAQAAAQSLTSNRGPPSCVEKPLKDPQAARLPQYPRQAVPNPPRSLEGEKLIQYDSTQLQQLDGGETRTRGDDHPLEMSHLDVLCAITELDRGQLLLQQQHDLERNALAEQNLVLLIKLVVSQEFCKAICERTRGLEALLDVETDGCRRDIEKEQATLEHSLEQRVEDWLRGIQEA